MSALVHVHGEFDRVRISIDPDDATDATIWLRTHRDTVSLTLRPDQFDALEAAIKVARERQAVTA